MLVTEYLAKNTYEMNFDDKQDFINKSIEALKLELLTNHLIHYKK